MSAKNDRNWKDGFTSENCQILSIYSLIQEMNPFGFLRGMSLFFSRPDDIRLTAPNGDSLISARLESQHLGQKC